jgi:hypothetical protein
MFMAFRASRIDIEIWSIVKLTIHQATCVTCYSYSVALLSICNREYAGGCNQENHVAKDILGIKKYSNAASMLVHLLVPDSPKHLDRVNSIKTYYSASS